MPITSSPTVNGQTSADSSSVSTAACAAALNSSGGTPLTSGRRWRITQPLSPSPSLIVAFSSSCVPRPDAKRQRSVVAVAADEQRARRERHQRAEPGADERHRLAQADAAAHRLRDLVERVALAVRLRDLREGAAVIRRPPRSSCAFLGGCIGPSGSCARSSSSVGVKRGRISGEMRDEWGRTPGRPRAEDLERGFLRHRSPIRPVGRERIERVDHGEDARANRDLFAAQTGRVAGPVPALVMAPDERRDRAGERDRARRSRRRPARGSASSSARARVSGPGFERMCSGTASLPMSWRSAAISTACVSRSDSSRRRARLTRSTARARCAAAGVVLGLNRARSTSVLSRWSCVHSATRRCSSAMRSR